MNSIIKSDQQLPPSLFRTNYASTIKPHALQLVNVELILHAPNVTTLPSITIPSS